MTINRSFVMLISLIVSGFLLCTSLDLTYEQAIELGIKFGKRDEEVEGRGIEYRGVGIHLGTTYSSVAVFKHLGPHRHDCYSFIQECSVLLNLDNIEVVKNERGSTTTPSCVAFTDSGILVGEPAKDQAPFNSQRTICGISRLIGRRFDDLDVQTYIKTLPYKVVNIQNKPYVEVEFKNGETKVFSPKQICALILWKMKEMAEVYMGTETEIAVVLAHPSFYNMEVRRSIMEAGEMTGLKSVFVKDSRSAVMLTRKLWPKWEFRVLVYNLGGSAFHVSLQDKNVEEDSFNITASRGDVHLGGQTFDTRVVDHFISLIKRKYNKDISNDSSALTKLRIECEKAKVSLSSTERVMIKINSLVDGILLFEEPLTRETFEDLNMDLFNKTIDLVRDVMNEVGRIEKSQVDEIVLVGGNTRIPKIRSMLKELFGKEPLKYVNPDEAVAFVATHMAGILSSKYDGPLDVVVTNPLSLGIETVGGIMSHGIRAGDFLPTISSQYVTTNHDGQTTVEIKVFEGERSLTKYCHYLGTLQMSDLPPSRRGQHTIQVTMEVDLYRNILVTAVHEATNNVKSMIIPAEQRYMTIKKKMEELLEPNESYEEDIKERTKVEEAMPMLMQQRDIMKFAVVDTDDMQFYFANKTKAYRKTTHYPEWK